MTRTLTRILWAAIGIAAALWLISTVAHADGRPVDAWIPYEGWPTIARWWAERERILATPDDKLTAEELQLKRNWQRR